MATCFSCAYSHHQGNLYYKSGTIIAHMIWDPMKFTCVVQLQ